MRIAIASDDGKIVSGHLGRCAGFAIYDIQEGSATKVEFRENIFTPHKTGNFEENHPPRSHQNGKHDALLSALSDCQMVVARGMGPRIYQDLASAGIKGLVTDIPMVEEAAERLASGEEIPEVEGECDH